MLRIYQGLVLVLLLSITSMAGATAETLRPNLDQGAEPDTADECEWGSSPTSCSSTDCWQSVDNDPDTGDGLQVVGAVCDGSGAELDFDVFWRITDSTEGQTWNGTQEIKVRWRNAGESSVGAEPFATIRAYCDSAPQGLGCTRTELTSLTESTATCTFVDADVSCTPDDIRIGILCEGSGGSPGGRRSCWVDSIELNGDFTGAGGAARRIWSNP